MKTFNDLYNDLQEYLTSLGFTLSLHNRIADFYLGNYELISVEIRYENIWYRTYPSYEEKWNKFYEVTKDDFDYIKELAVRLVRMYKHKQVVLAKKEIEKDFQ
jgi:hypothetical protein